MIDTFRIFTQVELFLSRSDTPEEKTIMLFQFLGLGSGHKEFPKTIFRDIPFGSHLLTLKPSCLEICSQGIRVDLEFLGDFLQVVHYQTPDLNGHNTCLLCFPMLFTHFIYPYFDRAKREGESVLPLSRILLGSARNVVVGHNGLDMPD